MRATKVNAGLAESNGRLLLGIWRDSLHVTCGLTPCTPGSAPGPTLGNENGKTVFFLPLLKDLFLKSGSFSASRSIFVGTARKVHEVHEWAQGLGYPTEKGIFGGGHVACSSTVYVRQSVCLSIHLSVPFACRIPHLRVCCCEPCRI